SDRSSLTGSSRASSISACALARELGLSLFKTEAGAQRSRKTPGAVASISSCNSEPSKANTARVDFAVKNCKESSCVTWASSDLGGTAQSLAIACKAFKRHYFDGFTL